MVQRKQMGRSQARPPAEIWETNASQRGKKPPSEWSKWELLTIFGTVFLLLYILLCYENFHFHVAHMYAHLGYPNAQHIVGQRYLTGVKSAIKSQPTYDDPSKGLSRQVRDSEAAEHGHPHSSFNLAVGKLKNMTVDLGEGEVEKLLSVAAGHGLHEAQNLLENIRNRNQA